MEGVATKIIGGSIINSVDTEILHSGLNKFELNAVPSRKKRQKYSYLASTAGRFVGFIRTVVLIVCFYQNEINFDDNR